MDKRGVQMLVVLAVYIVAMVLIITAFKTTNWMTGAFEMKTGLLEICAMGTCTDATHSGEDD